MQLRKLNRRVLRASFRCPCVFELVDSEKKKPRRSRSILGLHLRERERFLGGLVVGHCRRGLG